MDRGFIYFGLLCLIFKISLISAASVQRDSSKVLEEIVEFVHEDLNEDDPDIDAFTEAPPPKTTTEKKSDPDDLTTTDKVIIGVTCGLTGSVLIGAIIYGCSRKQKAKKERDAMHKSYLSRDEVALGASTSGGADNAGFSAGNDRL